MSYLLTILLSSQGLFRFLDSKWIAETLNSVGAWKYVIIFAVIFAESGILVGLFLPGDSLLFVAGFLAFNGDLNIWILLPLCFIAAFTGDQVGYLIGKTAGDHYFANENAKILKKSHIDKTHNFFEKHGSKTIVLARFVPIVRTLAPVMAGTAKMHYKTFITFNAIGAALWGVGVTLLGYFLGSTIGADKVDQYLLPIVALIVLLSLIPPFIEWRLAKKHSEEKEDTSVTN